MSVGYLNYDLSVRNKEYLASMISLVVGQKYSEILGFIQEIETDQELQSCLRQCSGIGFCFKKNGE